MTYFLVQFTYKDDQIKALLAEPQDRAAAVGQAVAAFEGKLHHFFFAYGEYDGVALMEFPDLDSANACLLTIIAGGGVASFKTTVLIEPEAALRAMRKAGSVQSGYAPPARRFVAFRDQELGNCRVATVTSGRRGRSICATNRAGPGKGRIRRRTSCSPPVIRRPTLPGRDSAQL